MILAGGCLISDWTKFDTSVEVKGQGIRVNNIGLMQQKSDLLYLGGSLAGVGIFTFIGGELVGKKKEDKDESVEKNPRSSFWN